MMRKVYLCLLVMVFISLLPQISAFDVTQDNGYLPLPVFFEATDNPWEDPTIVKYNWDFDNDGIIDQEGFNAAHVYESAGTFIANLTIMNNLGINTSETTTIIVNARTATVRYVDSAIGSDSCDGTSATVIDASDCPWETAQKAFETGCGSAGCSVLFNRGQIFDLTHVNRRITDEYYGPYGTGANPIIQYAGSTNQENMLQSNGVKNMSIVDLDFWGNTTAGLNATVFQGYSSLNLLVLRINASYIYQGILSQSAGDGVFIVDSDIGPSAYISVYTGKTMQHFVIMDSYIHDSGNHINYLESLNPGLIYNNRYENPATGNHAPRITGPSNNTLVKNNTFLGVADPTPNWMTVHMAPNNPDGKTNLSHILFEDNFVGGGETILNIGSAEYIKIRNNVFVSTTGSSHGHGFIKIGSIHNFDHKPSHDIEIIGNTIIYNTTLPGDVVSGFECDGNLFAHYNISFINNILQTDATYTTTSGSCDVNYSNNLFVPMSYDMGFVDGNVFGLGENFDGHLTATSTGAIDNGTLLSDSFFDYDRVARGIIPDIGAFEYVATGGSVELAISFVFPVLSTFYNYIVTSLTYLVAGDDLDACWWSNDSGVTNTSITCGVNVTTSSDEGSNTWDIWANNTGGTTLNDSVTFTVDTIKPVVNIVYPINNTYVGTDPVEVNYTVSDTNLASCSWSKNFGGFNYSIACGTNLSGSLANEQYNWTIFAVDDAGNVGYSTINFTVNVATDTTFPQISIVSPSNINYTSVRTKLDYIATDTNIDSCWYSLNDGVDNSTLQECSLNWTGLDSGEGSSTWKVWANDTFGNTNSSNVTFFVDSIDPSITLLTPSNNTVSANSFLEVNISTTDTNFKDVTFYLTGAATNTTNFTTSSNITFVSLSEGVYYWYVMAEDTLGNTNTSETRTYTIDTTYPSVSITTPENTSYTSVRTSLEYTYSDANIDSCWYSLNNGANTSITCGTNVTGLSSGEGSSTWTVWVNDSLNNLNSSSITFFVATPVTTAGGGGGSFVEEVVTILPSIDEDLCVSCIAKSLAFVVFLILSLLFGVYIILK